LKEDRERIVPEHIHDLKVTGLVRRRVRCTFLAEREVELGVRPC
jgi:hypothetical protein